MPELKIVNLNIDTDREIAILSKDCLEKFNFKVGERITLIYKERRAVVEIVGTIDKFEGSCIMLPRFIIEELHTSPGDYVNVETCPPSSSMEYIRKKLDGSKLTKEEIQEIVNDVIEGRLGRTEIASFLIAEYVKGLDSEEILYLSRAMVESGEKISFSRPVYSKHSIGGVPGNKVSLLIVPIVAADGLLIPKTSSKAITSPAGTADTMEVLANVKLEIDEFKRIVEKIGGAIVWGKALGLAPADDVFAEVGYKISLNPESQMVASIMAKKAALGVNFLVMDVPYGEGSKVRDLESAVRLSRMFVELGEKLGIRVECGITYGSQPVGHAVGPALEAKEALETLMGGGPGSLVEKSTALAGILLEMGGKATYGNGRKRAKEILRSGKAYEKMREIIEAQGGDPDIKPDDIPVGPLKETFYSPADGYVAKVSNEIIKRVARAAGAPVDKGAGILLFGKQGERVREGQPLFEIYAEKHTKLEEACTIARTNPPVSVESTLIKRISYYM